MSALRIHAAQLTPQVGAIQANAEALVKLAQEIAAEKTADLLLLPEMFLVGANAGDLLHRPELASQLETALEFIRNSCKNLPLSLLVGLPRLEDGKLQNKEVISSFAYLNSGRWQFFTSSSNQTHQICLQGCALNLVFGSQFLASKSFASQETNQPPADAWLIACADSWQQGRHYLRLDLARQLALEKNTPVVLLNQFGGQGQLVYDGASCALNAKGEVQVQAPAWQAAALNINLILEDSTWQLTRGKLANWPENLGYLYAALVESLRAYVAANGFQGVVFGMSGGLDSALTAALAVDALGAERVHGVMLPYRYTASISLEDAQEAAQLLGMHYQTLPIEPVVTSLQKTLEPSFSKLETSAADTTEQNLQARSRGVLLMALANKQGLLLLSTSNKSELAVGYCTLYGDMAGGFNLLKDVYKTQVFALSRWRNQQSYVIPQRIIERPPSAELAPNQQDVDSLPDYPVLDKILHSYLEANLSPAQILDLGWAEKDVRQLVRLVDFNEFKRQQAAPGPQVSQMPLGNNRQLPLVQSWRHGF